MFARRPILALSAVAASAAAGATLVWAAYAFGPGFTLEMDRPMPAIVSGFHGVERVNRETFAWTRREATMRLPGLDRRQPWDCTIRLRGGRQDVSTLPEAIISVDGIVTLRHQTGNDFSDPAWRLPESASNGAVITLTASNTFIPGGGDKRELGLYVDRWSCTPLSGFVPFPPGPVMQAAAIAAGAFALVLIVMGASPIVLAAGITTLGALQAVPLVSGLGSFGAFALPPAWVAVTLAAGLWVTSGVLSRLLGRPVSTAGRVALFVTVAALYLKLLMLFHPAKPIVDIVFHAHRLQWVLDGRYYFTQPMPSGVVFPYAIGLYVFAAPWTVLTSDFESLLRVIVTTAEAAGALCVYLLVARCWGDRTVAATATVLYALVPRTFEIVGNANMTNAFGQSVALAVLTAATLWALSWGRWTLWAGFTALLAFALLCHISTFMLLGAIVGVLTVLYWVAGDQTLRSHALSTGTALIVAAALAIALYYAHFGDAYRSAAKVRAAPAATSATGSPVAPAAFPKKVADAARLSVQAVGWPIALLAVPGVWVWRRRGWRDRLGLAVSALAITFGLFTLVVVLSPVNQSFQRYAAEFISRVTLATYPAMVIWAALGAVWAWRTGPAGRLAGGALMVAACVVGFDAWVEWIR